MHRNNLTRILAFLGATVALPTATAAPPSASVGQIETPSRPDDAPAPLRAPPRGADLARATQVAPDGNAAADGSGFLDHEETGAEAAQCLLGPQIAAIAAALPLDGAGLGDICAGLLWLESETRPAQEHRGVRSLHGAEIPAPALEAPAVEPSADSQSEPGDGGMDQPAFPFAP